MAWCRRAEAATIFSTVFERGIDERRAEGASREPLVAIVWNADGG
jgi:hypothetical protein